MIFVRMVLAESKPAANRIFLYWLLISICFIKECIIFLDVFIKLRMNCVINLFMKYFKCISHFAMYVGKT